MISRLIQAGEPSKAEALINGDDQLLPQTNFTNNDAPVNGSNDYRFSIGKLPVWAKKQIFERSGSLTPPSPTFSSKGIFKSKFFPHLRILKLKNNSPQCRSS